MYKFQLKWHIPKYPKISKKIVIQWSHSSNWLWLFGIFPINMLLIYFTLQNPWSNWCGIGSSIEIFTRLTGFHKCQIKCKTSKCRFAHLFFKKKEQAYVKYLDWSCKYDVEQSTIVPLLVNYTPNKLRVFIWKCHVWLLYVEY